MNQNKTLNSQKQKKLITMNYDIIVIGSGPGGYVTAIRASQLGFKTAIIEKENLGGICLNWGCIPTKALLKSAQVFKYINHAEDFGLNKVEASFDFPNVVQRSRGVAEKMSKGVEFLMKKNKIDVIMGYGTIKLGKKVDVKDKDGKVTEYSADHIIIATEPTKERLESYYKQAVSELGAEDVQAYYSRTGKVIRLSVASFDSSDAAYTFLNSFVKEHPSYSTAWVFRNN